MTPIGDAKVDQLHYHGLGLEKLIGICIISFCCISYLNLNIMGNLIFACYKEMEGNVTRRLSFSFLSPNPIIPAFLRYLLMMRAKWNILILTESGVQSPLLIVTIAALRLTSMNELLAPSVYFASLKKILNAE